MEQNLVVSKEINNMNNEEVRLKLIKIAQAYRDERVRNHQFENELKILLA